MLFSQICIGFEVYKINEGRLEKMIGQSAAAAAAASPLQSVRLLERISV